MACRAVHHATFAGAGVCAATGEAALEAGSRRWLLRGARCIADRFPDRAAAFGGYRLAHDRRAYRFTRLAPEDECGTGE